MYKFTLGFIKRENQLLMLNRNKAPWMGSWNGVGGKIELNEDPLTSIIREVFEETSIKVEPNQVIYKGTVTWNNDFSSDQGLYLYLINIEDNYEYITPVSTIEGILDFKDISWVSDFDNYGLSHNIPYFINDVVNNDKLFNHHCIFNDKILVSVTKEELK